MTRIKNGSHRRKRCSLKVGDSATRRHNYTRQPSIEEIKLAAAGRWKEIFYDAGGIPHGILDSRGHSCPRCGGHDRFAAFKDVAQRGSVLCRACFNADTNPRPGDGIATIQWLHNCDTSTACIWLAQWLGLTKGQTGIKSPPLSRTVPLRTQLKSDSGLACFANSCHRSMKPDWWSRLESLLGLPVAAMRSLRVGWSARDNATTWPMVDQDNNVVGIRLRCMKSGRKWSVSGGKAGLFVPVSLPPEVSRLFILEGPTDTAAMLSLGFDCIGRPSCSGAVPITVSLLRKLQLREVVIVADDDTNGAGKRGAESLARKLVAVSPSVRIISPPERINDARDWVRGGATAEAVLAVVDAAHLRTLSMRKESQQ